MLRFHVKKFPGLRFEERVKHWDFYYRTPEELDCRHDQLAKIAELIREEGPDDYLTHPDASWRRKRPEYSYAEHKRERELYAGATASDPLGLNCDPDTSGTDPKSNYYLEKKKRESLVKSNSTKPEPKPVASNERKPLSKEEMDKIVQERRKQRKREREMECQRIEEEQRKRREALEFEAKERQRREEMRMKKMLVDKKVIEETRNIPKALKEFDIVGSILLPQVMQTTVHDTTVKDDTAHRETVGRCTSGAKMTFYCEACDITTYTMKDNVRHCNSTEHFIKKQLFEERNGTGSKSQVEEYYKKNEKLYLRRNEMMAAKAATKPDSGSSNNESLKAEERPPSPLNSPTNSPCPSNAPSVDSLDEVEPPPKPKVTTVALATPSPPPVRTRSPPTVGMARVCHLLNDNQPLTLPLLSGMVNTVG